MSHKPHVPYEVPLAEVLEHVQNDPCLSARARDFLLRFIGDAASDERERAGQRATRLSC